MILFQKVCLIPGCFRTGQPDYTLQTAWAKWQDMCDRRGKDYRAIKLLRNNEEYKLYMTYLNYDPRIQAMIYTTNRIERLNRDFSRVIKMRTAMPNEEAVITPHGQRGHGSQAILSTATQHHCRQESLPGSGFLSRMVLL